MVHFVQRVVPGLPVASLAFGVAGQPLALALPPALVGLYAVHRHRRLRHDIGTRAWPSEAFVRHALVHDLGRLLCFTLVGVPLFGLGLWLRSAWLPG